MAISVVDSTNPYALVTVRGKVVEQTAEEADRYIDLMAKKYLGMGRYPFAMPGEKWILLRIKPEQAFFIRLRQ